MIRRRSRTSRYRRARRCQRGLARLRSSRPRPRGVVLRHRISRRRLSFRLIHPRAPPFRGLPMPQSPHDADPARRQRRLGAGWGPTFADRLPHFRRITALWEVTGGVAVEPAIACAASHTVRRVSFSLDVAVSQRRAYAAAAATLSIPNGRMSRKCSGPPAGRGRRVCRDRKSTRLNSSHGYQSRMPSSA